MVNEYSIENEMSAEQLDQLYALTQKMWWSTDRTREDIATMLKHCLPFAVIDGNTNQLVGFARVLTDEIRYAYIYDVITEDQLRGKGIGKMLMHAVLSHPRLSHVKYFELTCAHDMVEYYNKLGFSKDFETVVAMRFTKKINN